MEANSDWEKRMEGFYLHVSFFLFVFLFGFILAEAKFQD